MEKRLFLAISLSLLILVLWSYLFPPPARVNFETNNPQLIDNNKDTNIQANEFTNLKAEPAPPSLPEKSADEKLIALESDQLEVSLSNLGGNIKTMTVLAHNATLPVENILSIMEYENHSFRLEDISDGKIVYSLQKDGFLFKKFYQIEPGDYTLKAKVEITNISTVAQPLSITIGNMRLNMSRVDKKIPVADHALFEYFVAIPQNIIRKANAVKFSDKESHTIQGPVNLLGFRDKYFSAIIQNEFKLDSIDLKSVSSTELLFSFTPGNIILNPNEKVDFTSLFYFGPQDTTILSKIDKNFESIVSFSSFGIVDGIAKFLYNTLRTLNKFIPNWGFCIILVSFLVYGATYPLTILSMSSMKKMQNLQPEIVNLRNKYQNNPQKVNQEMIELYRKHRVNPLSGCFILLLQMPIFIALYQVLWRSIYFKGADFLWIKDLSQPDRLFILTFNLPFLGNEFNILPIVMAFSMYLQQKITSKSMVITDPSQEAQQKMMKIFLPIMMGFLFYKFASGLTLYFTMFYLLSTFTQMKVNSVKKA